MAKKHITLVGCAVEVQMKTSKVGFDGEDRTCDFKFQGENVTSCVFMMESDARALAVWILENTKEVTLQ